MGKGIIVCGLNGSGKSTLAKALAGAMGFHFIDNEDLFFPKTDARYLYASGRTREEVTRLLMDEVCAHEDFVFAAVKGDYGKAIAPFYRFAVVICVPKDERMRRIRSRSYEKFGGRMLPGGDLHEREEAFFAIADAREERYVEDWVQTLDCPVIRVDGMKPVAENVARIMAWLQNATA